MFSGIEIRSTLRRLTRLVPLILFVVGVDVIADPARVLRDGRYEREIATILLSGRHAAGVSNYCLLYTSPSPRDRQKSRMPSSA